MSTQAQGPIDFRTYYDLEPYLFDTVSKRFTTDHTLSAFDFFCIVIWKANRAKSKIARRLMEHGTYPDLDAAVRALVGDVAAASTPKDKLRVLFNDWGLLIPTASAILTVLYPSEFTVYDIRVCDELGDFHWVANISRYDRLWDAYEKYVATVKRAAPDGLPLRDKDRWLWGKSFAEELRQDVATVFTRTKKEPNRA